MTLWLIFSTEKINRSVITFQQDGAAIQRTCKTVKLLKPVIPDFIPPKLVATK